MSDLRKAAEMALEVFEHLSKGESPAITKGELVYEIAALRQALAEQERELTDEEINAHSRKMLANLKKNTRQTTENAVVQAVENMKREGWFDLPNDIDAYERGVIDGMQKQMKSTVEKAVNAMTKREWQGLTDEERADCWSSSAVQSAISIEAKLKEKNT